MSTSTDTQIADMPLEENTINDPPELDRVPKTSDDAPVLEPAKTIVEIEAQKRAERAKRFGIVNDHGMDERVDRYLHKSELRRNAREKEEKNETRYNARLADKDEIITVQEEIITKQDRNIKQLEEHIARQVEYATTLEKFVAEQKERISSLDENVELSMQNTEQCKQLLSRSEEFIAQLQGELSKSRTDCNEFLDKLLQSKQKENSRLEDLIEARKETRDMQGVCKVICCFVVFYWFMTMLARAVAYR